MFKIDQSSSLNYTADRERAFGSFFQRKQTPNIRPPVADKPHLPASAAEVGLVFLAAAERGPIITESGTGKVTISDLKVYRNKIEGPDFGRAIIVAEYRTRAGEERTTYFLYTPEDRRIRECTDVVGMGAAAGKLAMLQKRIEVLENRNLKEINDAITKINETERKPQGLKLVPLLTKEETEQELKTLKARETLLLEQVDVDKPSKA